MTPEERARETIDELLRCAGLKLPMQIWLRDESLEDSDNLPDPDIIALEIVEDLETALEQFRLIAEDIGG